jgi:autotransporter strand-loop-strand O-heptosyltransferase
MKIPKIYVHGSYIGTTGYNNHTRDFFRELSKYYQIKVRNFTVGSSWDGNKDNAHDNETYINDVDKSLLYQQRLWVGDGKMEDFKIYQSPEKEFFHDFNIVLNETNHRLYYEKYTGPKIAYNVWESTRQPDNFFKKLLTFDEIWVPSQWQKECTIEQGADPDKVKVVPEGVDVDTFYPETVEPLDQYKDGRFKFLLMGRWDYRKSTKEIIETFLKTFTPDEPVDLVVSIDNMWGEEMDGFKTTEERLQNYGLIDPRIQIIHFPTREDYIKYLKTGHVFVSCARSEGWNLPLIEAMACGTPSIYSECCAQMEFAEGKGLPVKILGEKPANQNDYGRYTMSELPGNYYEPDFDDLSKVMRDAYKNYDTHKERSVIESSDLREKFSWEEVAKIGKSVIEDFMVKITSDDYVNKVDTNTVDVTYFEGPKVEILGDYDASYFVEFIDGKTNKIVHSQTITNNMWCMSSRKYYTDWIIKVNGKVVSELNLNNKRVLISFESKSIGDTIAWAPYVVDFSKKHNCKVILSTFHNNWFEDVSDYSDIEFIKPGQTTKCDAVYRVGWFRSESNRWDKFDCYPNPVNSQALQKTSSDILGLEFVERNYGIKFQPKNRPFKNKYIVISPESTAGCKEWGFDSWKLLIKMLGEKGYDVVCLTKKPYSIPGARSVHGKTLEESFNILFHAEYLVGLSSGLAWINWSLGKHTVMISGFTAKEHEFQTNITRIQNEHACNSCWANTNFVFDPGDWDWCPIWKGTDKQHICTKSISPLTVFNSLPK